jgi:predicted outer membrane repeat protein
MRGLPIILSVVFVSLLLPGCGQGEFDVYLKVESEYGSPVPPVGDNHLNLLTTITASVDSPVAGSTGIRYICTGWTGTGSVPATGSENSVTFAITQNSSITWLWKIQYQLTTEVSPIQSGTVEVSPASADGYYDEGAILTLSATPGSGDIFHNWSGDLSGGDNPETLSMDGPKNVTANFVMLPIADFIGTPRRGFYPLTVQFTDTSRGIATFWEWDFDNNGTADSTEQNPTYTYTEGGRYTVKLSVTGFGGSDVVVKGDYIIVGLTVYVDGANGLDTNDGMSWETAVKTIQAGIDNARTDYTVLVANGTYTGTGNKDLDFRGIAIHLKSVGGAENCIIDCGNSGRGFYFHSGETSASMVEGFTIQNGRGGTGEGAVYCSSSSPTITNCTFSGNSGIVGGGAVYCYYSSPIITNCTFSGNSAVNCGGAVCCSYYSSPTITNCTFSQNLARYYGGGAVCCGDYSSPAITNCTFSENSAGTYVGYGGAVYCQDGSSPTITNCTFSGNSAVNCGGAVYCEGSKPITTNCAFSGNWAEAGGAVFCFDSSPTVTNCTLTENSAEHRGGAVYCSYYSSPTITNSILWSNTATSGGNEIYIYDSSSSATLNNSDVTPGGYGGETDNITENSCIHLDPLFVDAGNGNYRLAEGSPCIDAGDNSLVPAEITTDLDGNPRIYPEGGTVDIGAYEYQP